MMHDDVYYRHVSELAQVLRRAIAHLDMVKTQVEPTLYSDVRQSYLRQSAAAEAELLEIRETHARTVADNLAALAQAQRAIDAAIAEIRTLREQRDAFQHGAAHDTAPLSFYHDMIPLQEALLAEWQLHKADIERRIARQNGG
jgi:hypothetical protein